MATVILPLSPRVPLSRAMAVLLAVLAMTVALVTPAGAQPISEEIEVIVTAADGSVASAADAVDAIGGTVTGELVLVGGVAATVSLDSLPTLQADPAVNSATIDAKLTPQDDDDDEEDDDDEAGWGGSERGTSLYEVAKTINADDYWYSGYRGGGVDIAIIDTGVAPIDGLDGYGRVVNGIDLSFEGQNDEFRFLDSNGHGTHMAGIIGAYDRGDESSLKGIAYQSRIVNVKVGSFDGSVDVSQAIAAIDWVVQNKDANGLNIRVLNLSYGTDSLQDPAIDPLAYAVEQAWRAGIVVVVAAGNEGPGVPLNNPAGNPYVISVGATDINSNYYSSDDVVADFSSCGVERTVDIVAPGKSIESLWVPNSTADVDHPDARVTIYDDDDRWRLFKGSGSSQAAAVVSGAVALIIDQRPDITPDAVKALLVENARPVSGSASCQGAGQIDLGPIRRSGTPAAAQDHPPAQGNGSLEKARGSKHVSLDDVDLVGEEDAQGNDWDVASWLQAVAAGTSWSGDFWNGTSWSGTSWSGTSWSGTSWSGTSWSDYVWTGTSWSGTSWSGTSWSGTSWSGDAWNESVWSGLSWG